MNWPQITRVLITWGLGEARLAISFAWLGAQLGNYDCSQSESTAVLN